MTRHATTTIEHHPATGRLPHARAGTVPGDSAGRCTEPAAATAADHRDRRSRAVGLAVVAVAAVGLLLNGAFLAWRGLLVDDEGWYLQAARAVAHGALPYRDFAFTQGPLSPYLFAPGQAITGGSLLAGRLTALVFIAVLFVVAVRSAWRAVGPLTGAAMAILLASDTGTTWSFSMAKAYGLTALFLVAMAACLVGSRHRERMLAWGVLFAGLAALTRFSAVVTWGVVAVACLLAARTARGRLLVVLAALPPVVGYGGLYLLAPAQTRFGLWGYHQLTVHTAGLGHRWHDLVDTRLPDVVATYTVPLTIACVAAAMACTAPGALAALRRAPGPLIAAAGTAAFMAGNFAAGEWHSDYLLPAVPAVLFLSVIAAGHVAGRTSRTGPTGRPGQPAAAVLVAAVLVGALLVIRPGWGIGLDHFPGDRTGLGRAQAMAAQLAAATRPGDRVLALQGAAVTLEAGRDTVPGDTLAQFSYIDTPTENAARLGVLNADMLVGLVRNAEPSAVLLSDWDLVLLGRRGTVSEASGDAAPFITALHANYRPVAVQTGYGQGENTLTLYVRR